MNLVTTHRNAHAIDSEVTKAENARAVSDDANLGGMRPIPQHGANRLCLLDRDIQRLGEGVETRILQADVANGGRINQRHEFAHVIHEDAVEQIDVLVLEIRQVEILVDVGRATADHVHDAGALRIQALHNVRDQARQVLVDAGLGRKREALEAALLASSDLPFSRYLHTGQKKQKKITLVPQRIPKDLVSGRRRLGHIHGEPGLVHLVAMVAFFKTTQLVERLRGHGGLDDGYVGGMKVRRDGLDRGR